MIWSRLFIILDIHSIVLYLCGNKTNHKAGPAGRQTETTQVNNDETALSKARDIRAQFPTVAAFKTWIADAAGKSPSRRSDDERFIITMMVRQPDVIEAATEDNTMQRHHRSLPLRNSRRPA